MSAHTSERYCDVIDGLHTFVIRDGDQLPVPGTSGSKREECHRLEKVGWSPVLAEVGVTNLVRNFDTFLKRLTAFWGDQCLDRHCLERSIEQMGENRSEENPSIRAQGIREDQGIDTVAHPGECPRSHWME